MHDKTLNGEIPIESKGGHMNTNALVEHMNVAKAAMTAEFKARTRADALKIWRASGGTEASFAKIDPVHFLSVNAGTQAALVAEMEKQP